MFASTDPATGALRANCEVVPNSDITGIGIRYSLYLQSLLLILTTAFQQTPSELFLSNLTIQVTSASLIGAAFFDPNIDVPHAIVASLFATLFSAIRATSYDLPVGPIRRKQARDITVRLFLLDLIFRTLLVTFNVWMWGWVLTLQNGNPCHDGFGKWSFFSKPVDLAFRNPAVTFAYVAAILDCIWEASRYVCGVLRILSPGSVSSEQFRRDPRLWFMKKAVSVLSRRLFKKPQQGKRPSSALRLIISRSLRERASSALRLIISRGLRFLYYLRRVFVFVFVVVSIERTVTLNGLESSEDRWATGQIMSMIDLACLSYQLISLVIRWLPYDRMIGYVRIPAFIIAPIIVAIVFPGFLRIVLDWSFNRFGLEVKHNGVGWDIAYFIYEYIVACIAVLFSAVLFLTAVWIILGLFLVGVMVFSIVWDEDDSE
jgi:hypothetical protein